MPSRASFTRLCQQTWLIRDRKRADLHIHSTHSDGAFTPREIIARAEQAGLSAFAITDHDTMSGFIEAKKLATGLEIASGVEITVEFQQREIHLLAYFIDPEHSELQQALHKTRLQRQERIAAMALRLRELGVSIDDRALQRLLESGAALGRRHL